MAHNVTIEDVKFLDVLAKYMYDARVFDSAVLKGGYLLSKLTESRCTIDIDLSAPAGASLDTLLNRFNSCGDVLKRDGLIEDFTVRKPKEKFSGEFHVIRKSDKQEFSVDFSIQDLGFGILNVDIILGNRVAQGIRCYSFERILSDKIQALNTLKQFRRMKDLFDMYTIVITKELSRTALEECFSFRNLSDEILTGIVNADTSVAEFSIFREDAIQNLQHAWDKLKIMRVGSDESITIASHPDLVTVLSIYRDFLSGYLNCTSSFSDRKWNPIDLQWV